MRKLLTLWIALAAIVAVTASSFGGSMMLLGVGSRPPSVGGGGTPTFTWADSKVLTGTPPPGSFAAASIGTASSDRIVVAGISWQGTASTNMDITAVTIGGVTATQVAYNRSSAGAWNLVCCRPDRYYRRCQRDVCQRMG
jgi:hypothetical protein